MNINRTFPTIEPKNETVNSLIGNYTGGTYYPGNGDSGPWTIPALNPIPAVASSNSVSQFGPWLPAKTAAGDFLKVQYADVEVRCAITRKMLPAGSPVMLLGGMVISAEAFERWLEEQLVGMISRHQDLHTDNQGYDE
jgi:hypothetical protein